MLCLDCFKRPLDRAQLGSAAYVGLSPAWPTGSTEHTKDLLGDAHSDILILQVIPHSARMITLAKRRFPFENSASLSQLPGQGHGLQAGSEAGAP